MEMVGGKWSDLGYILKRQSVSFADRLFVGRKRRRIKDNFKDFCSRNGKNQEPFPEIGTRQVTLILQRRSGVSLCLRCLLVIRVEASNRQSDVNLVFWERSWPERQMRGSPPWYAKPDALNTWWLY